MEEYNISDKRWQQIRSFIVVFSPMPNNFPNNPQPQPLKKCTMHIKSFLLISSFAVPPTQTLPVLSQLLHLHLQTLNFVSKVLFEEPVGL